MGLDVINTDLDALLQREWLAVNRIGGFACSSSVGLNTRKYHGLLVAALVPPVRRFVLLSRIDATVTARGWNFPLACNEYPGAIDPRGDQSLRAFSPGPFPRWAYQGDGWTLEKSVRLLRGENTVVVSFALLCADEPVELELRPMFALRPMHELMYQATGRFRLRTLAPTHHQIPATGRTPDVFFAHDGVFSPDEGTWYLNNIYRREQERGYRALEDLWNPGVVRCTLRPGQTASFACSTRAVDLPRVLLAADEQYAPAAAPASGPRCSVDEPTEMLLAAADQFVLQVPSAERDPRCFVVANYPWGAPSPRQSLIGFAGLFLVPGKLDVAKCLLFALAERLRGGLLPSGLREADAEPVYQGADVSLWFVNAVHQFARYAPDDPAVTRLGRTVAEIVERYAAGPGLGIHVDADGLIGAGIAGAAVTWMDAQLDDCVITPRIGKPVELNALWYNAQRVAADLARQAGQRSAAERLDAQAARTQAAFNTRFWNAGGQCCYDVIDSPDEDASVRPNQLLAIALPFAVLSQPRWDAVLDRVRHELLVPGAVRTLSPLDARYQPVYRGNVLSRDWAYHNGSAFVWLLGSYVTAYLRVHGRGPGARGEAKQVLEPALAQLCGEGLGQLCELLDGDKPHRPGGAIASATAVAEVLRAYAEEVLDLQPSASSLSTPQPA